METDSPIRKPDLKLVIKKLFHSPMSDHSPERVPLVRLSQKKRKTKKRKLTSDSAEKIKKVFVTECDKDGHSGQGSVGMRRKVLISLFHNKEYSMDCEISS
jgi:hypothetical protein